MEVMAVTATTVAEAAATAAAAAAATGCCGDSCGDGSMMRGRGGRGVIALMVWPYFVLSRDD